MMMAQKVGAMTCFVVTLFLSGCATQEDQPVSSGSSTGSSRSSMRNAEGQGRPASGTSGDSLKACMDRTPSDASAGQRMMAEQSCQRDEGGRKSMQSVPGTQ